MNKEVVKIIQVVLDRLKDRQINLGSESARTSIAYEIGYALEDRGLIKTK